MKIGDRFLLREIHATKYPEKNFIRDLLHHYESMAEAISEEEYHLMRDKAIKSKDH